MSLKMIELQIAIPRTHEAGRIQEQIQQREHAIQSHASDVVKKDQEFQSNSVVKQEQKGNASLQKHNGEGNQQHRNKKQKNQEKNKGNAQKKTHPYKGAFIDMNG